jgi:hypothetical protein
MMAAFAANPDDIKKLKGLLDAVVLARSLPFPVDLWRMQNTFWGVMADVYPQFKQKAENNEGTAQEWVSNFVSLGKELLIRVE